MTDTAAAAEPAAQPQTRTLDTEDAHLVYDVRGPLPTADGQPPLVLIGSPMGAGGFGSLAAHLTDRTVVTYDPAGIERSTRTDGGTDITPQRSAGHVHAIIGELGSGPVDLFGTSGGAVVGLALVAAHPDDVRVLVAHEPPVLGALPDAEQAHAANDAVLATYQSKGWGAGMAHFIALASWQGEFTPDFAAQPAPDPAMFGMPTGDDGSRDDPLLSGRSRAITDFEPDFAAIQAAPTRVVIAIGEETGAAVTARTSHGVVAGLGQQAEPFPGDHGGFMGGEYGQPAGKPAEFAAKLREVLDPR